MAAETARAYANMCAAGMQLASARHSLEVQKSSLDAIERLQRAGRGTALDVTRARSQLQQLQANLPPFQAQQRTALYRLAALTGRTPAQIPASLLQCATAPRLTQTIPVGDGAALRVAVPTSARPNAAWPPPPPASAWPRPTCTPRSRWACPARPAARGHAATAAPSAGASGR